MRARITIVLFLLLLGAPRPGPHALRCGYKVMKTAILAHQCGRIT